MKQMPWLLNPCSIAPSVKAAKIAADAKTEMDHQVEYIERYPPDTAAAIFWLKNRQREQWREKSEQAITSDNKTELSGVVGIVEIPGLAEKLAKFNQ